MYSRYKRQRIVHFARMGYKPPTICRMLREEGLIANRMGIHKFLQKHRETNNIERRPGSGRPTKMTAPVKALVEQRMRDDDETTAVQLHALLLRHGHTMALKTVLRCRAALGWTFRGSAYCQLIRQENKVKRLQWAQEHLSEGAATARERTVTGCESFVIVLFSDESFCDRFFIVLEPPSVSFKRMGCFVQRKRSFRFRFVL